MFYNRKKQKKQKETQSCDCIFIVGYIKNIKLSDIPGYITNIHCTKNEVFH